MRQLLFFFIYLLFVSCGANDKEHEISTIPPDSTKNTQSEHTEPDTLLNTEDYLVIGRKPANIILVKEDSTTNLKSYDTIATDGDNIFFGKNKSDDFQIYKKYHPTKSFEDYPVEVYTGPLAPPDFTTNPGAKRFITRIKEGCKEGVNFAGHYTLIMWGCGTSCQSSAIVDRKTGRIFTGFGSEWGLGYRKDSRLLIRNIGAIDSITNLIPFCPYCDVTLHVWREEKFKEVE